MTLFWPYRKWAKKQMFKQHGEEHTSYDMSLPNWIVRDPFVLLKDHSDHLALARSGAGRISASSVTLYSSFHWNLSYPNIIKHDVHQIISKKWACNIRKEWITKLKQNIVYKMLSLCLRLSIWTYQQGVHFLREWEIWTYLNQNEIKRTAKNQIDEVGQTLKVFFSHKKVFVRLLVVVVLWDYINFRREKLWARSLYTAQMTGQKSFSSWRSLFSCFLFFLNSFFANLLQKWEKLNFQCLVRNTLAHFPKQRLFSFLSWFIGVWNKLDC